MEKYVEYLALSHTNTLIIAQRFYLLVCIDGCSYFTHSIMTFCYSQVTLKINTSFSIHVWITFSAYPVSNSVNKRLKEYAEIIQQSTIESTCNKQMTQFHYHNTKVLLKQKRTFL